MLQEKTSFICKLTIFTLFVVFKYEVNIPTRSHGHSYAFYKVANTYEFVWMTYP